jgi:hypothetical protein
VETTTAGHTWATNDWTQATDDQSPKRTQRTTLTQRCSFLVLSSTRWQWRRDSLEEKWISPATWSQSSSRSYKPIYTSISKNLHECANDITYLGIGRNHGWFGEHCRVRHILWLCGIYIESPLLCQALLLTGILASPVS